MLRIHKPTQVRKKLRSVGKAAWRVITFVGLLTIYMIGRLISGILNIKPIRSRLKDRLRLERSRLYLKLIAFLDPGSEKSISRIYLIDLSIKNMRAKKTRTFITIGGMTIGIGAIVFLVSVGYGLQNLVITRVARLDEMRQTEVSPQAGGKIKITDKTVSDVKEISGVEMVLPMIAVVGRVNYQNSVSDMAVYGVTTEYLTQSAIKPAQGKIFESNDLSVPVALLPDQEGEVAGVEDAKTSARWGDKIADVELRVLPEEWVKVRNKPSTQGETIGYLKRIEWPIAGEEIWGGGYDADDGAGMAGMDENGVNLGRWVRATYPLWQKIGADYQISDDGYGGQSETEGYIAEVNVMANKVINEAPHQVLAAETDLLGEMVASGSGDWVELASESALLKKEEVKIVPLFAKAIKQAVVNRAMLKVLNIKENEAIGRKFATSFVVVGSLLSDGATKIQSKEEEYTIVAVTPDDKTAVFYVPFVDLRSLGITNYSQLKVVTKNTDGLAKVRKQVEALGFGTKSVADTVNQINSLFATLRTVLALLGMVALAVASLGMFNTLTVSLLERTREVGLMKALGMRSSEVQELFLTESMLMGFFGGIIGIFVGFAMGKFAGLLLSVLAVARGVGMVDISYIPGPFVVIVVVLSLMVGVLTGIYPARRATRISALDAMRYE